MINSNLNLCLIIKIFKLSKRRENELKRKN